MTTSSCSIRSSRGRAEPSPTTISSSRRSPIGRGPAGRDLNFNAYADNRSLFRYEMHTLPSEVADSIGTSTAFAAWNAAIYVAQIEDDRLGNVVSDGRYLDATREALRKHNGLWFYDESYVISRRRD